LIVDGEIELEDPIMAARVLWFPQLASGFRPRTCILLRVRSDA
jgi:hypothetical protein